jgi:isoamylase
MLIITFLSVGTPLLLMGDESRRTQMGNNNAYCQDNEMSWLDWQISQPRAELRRFVRLLIQFRMQFAKGIRGLDLSLGDYLMQARYEWHGTELWHPDWTGSSHSIAYTIHRPDGPNAVHIIVNAYWEELEFELPPPAAETGSRWYRIIDTYLESPDDISSEGKRCLAAGMTYRAKPRSVVVLSLE